MSDEYDEGAAGLAQKLVDWVSTVTQLEEDELPNVEDWRRNAAKLYARELRCAAAEGEARGLERAADWLESDADCDDNLFTLARKLRALKAVPRCTRPPEGWRCTREAGHDGPCAAVLRDVPGAVKPPHDGGPAMRPHTIPGWWQVWSGGICVALLRPEDVPAEVPRG